MATDLEIARTAEMKPIEEIAQAAGIATEALSPYGRYIAKVDPAALPQRDARARLVLVTAINPTPAGEGQTTVSVALADGMRKLGKNAERRRYRRRLCAGRAHGEYQPALYRRPARHHRSQ